MGMSRRSRDYLDCQKILEWLQIRSLFQYEDQTLHSLSLSLVSDGKDEINCDQAEKTGLKIQELLDNMEITKCKIKRNDQIRPLIYRPNNIKFSRQQLVFNPTIFFTRLAAIAQREEEDIEAFFSHELTQEPM